MATVAPGGVSRASREARASEYFADSGRYLRGRHGIALRAEVIARALSGRDLGDVIDLGCGDGAIVEPLREQARTLTLVDRSPDMLRAAMNRLGAEPTFDCADIHAPRAQRFDTAICAGILAHVDSTELTLNAASALLRPGGRLVLQISDQTKTVSRLSLRLASLRGKLLYRPLRLGDVVAAAAGSRLYIEGVHRYLIVPAGLQRLLGPLLIPIERLTIRLPWLARHAGDAILVMRKYHFAN